MRPRRVVVVGGGHNGLTAAAYLARAGVEVTLLERLPHLGGAAVSALAFPGVDARLSRYAYLVSLLPRRILDDLGIEVRLARRRYSSYTPVPGTERGLLIDNADPAVTKASFASIGAEADAAGFAAFYARTGSFAGRLFDSLTEPLPTREQAKSLVGGDWGAFVERPVGEVIRSSVADDLVRGVVATDALIGTFADLDDPGLEQNRCLLYHVIGGGTGDWDVPTGGMGVVSGGLERAARAAGARLVTGATVTSLTPDGEVRYRVGEDEQRVTADVILSGVAPAALAGLLGEEVPRPRGAQVKANLLLRRLPGLRQPGLAPAGGVRRHLPHQRVADPVAGVLRGGARRSRTGPAAVRNLLPLTGRPDDPARGRPRPAGARTGGSDADGVRPARAGRPGRAVRQRRVAAAAAGGGAFVPGFGAG